MKLEEWILHIYPLYACLFQKHEPKRNFTPQILRRANDAAAEANGQTPEITLLKEGYAHARRSRGKNRD